MLQVGIYIIWSSDQTLNVYRIPDTLDLNCLVRILPNCWMSRLPLAAGWHSRISEAWAHCILLMSCDFQIALARFVFIRLHHFHVGA